MKTPTIFFGASSFVIPIIEYLANAFDLKLVVTTEQKPTDAVPSYCQEHDILCVNVFSLKDGKVQQTLKDARVEFAVLADFGLLIPQAALDIFPKGIINIHPSLLPIYRGPTPGMSALLHGDTTTGVSIMLLDKDLDHGPLLGQITTDVKLEDTSATLYPRLFEEGTALLKKVLPAYIAGAITPQEQDHSKATFTEPQMTKEVGYFEDTNPDDSVTFERKVRAYFPWPTAWTRVSEEGRLKGKIIKFLPNPNPHSGETQNDDVGIKEKLDPGQAWTTARVLIQVEGKKPQTYKDFLNGYPEMEGWLGKIVGAKNLPKN